MSSSPKISFVLHDVARLLRKRFEQHSRTSGLSRTQWQVLAYLSPREGINQNSLADLIEIMRGNGQKTRDEAFAGLSSDAQHLLQTLGSIKSNLLAACTQPAVDREKVHG
ncbi:MarR family transcriptional regulator [Mesorhizobium sp. dw_380]|uniref:MarR family transcriptional regulator n=1 Tax=Mesorhizobium sp. dw_380 TaxID=2812001 RepID=UPI001BDF6E9C|nr:MarR family transcriptional regulator [Mesorhizobium sp. dw_380]